MQPESWLSWLTCIGMDYAWSIVYIEVIGEKNKLTKIKTLCVGTLRKGQGQEYANAQGCLLKKI